MKEPKSYQQAIEELSDIIAGIDQEQIPLDQLSAKIRRANEILSWCRNVLRETEDAFESGLNHE